MVSPFYKLHFILGYLMVTAVRGQQCLYTVEQLVALESFSNKETVREYSFCSGITLNIGLIDYNNKLKFGSGAPPIPLRSNLHLKCGFTGERENNCIVRGGDLQVDGTNYFGITDSDSIENVILEGFTFEQTTRYSVWATKKGDITFIDCEWRDITEAYAPIYFDYFDLSNRNTFLDVDFMLCDFKYNTYFGDGAYPALIVGNGDQNRLNFEKNYFLKNDFEFNNTDWRENSVLVETGGQVSLTQNCFDQNRVGVAHVVSYGNIVTSDGNFGKSLNETKCSYVASFKTQTQFDTFSPDCTNYEETLSCLRDETRMPSSSPTDIPSSKPSVSPTSLPSESPSHSPTTLPSTSPTTGAPSKSPTISSQPTVSSKPTAYLPSTTPSVNPTLSTMPTSSPSAKPSEASNQPSNQPSLEPTPAPTVASSATTMGFMLSSTLLTLVLLIC